MTIVTLRPTSTIGVSMVEVGGAAWQVLGDDSDATYVQAGSPGHNALVQMDDIALPSGAVVRGVRARIRQAQVGGWAQLVVWIRDASSTVVLEQVFNATWSITTLATAELTGPMTDSEVDGLQWAVYSTTSAGRVHEAYLDVTYVAQPVVTVTGPTGTVTDTTTPVVSWTRVLDADGGAQQYAHIKIFTAAQYGAGGFDPATSTATVDSGVIQPTGNHMAVGSASVWTPTTGLADGTYRAYVRIAQVVNGAQHWSAWGYSAFTVAVPRPAVPTLSLTAENTAGRVLITPAGSGTPSVDAFELQRLTDGAWVPVRLRDGDQISAGYLENAPGKIPAYDYEAANGAATTYRARSVHDYGGVYATSAWVEAAVTWASSTWWLKDPLRPALNVPVELVTYGDVSRAARQGVFQPLGAVLPVIVADTRAGASGASTVRTRTTAAKDALEATVSASATLLLQGPVAAGEPDRYVRVGDLSASRVIENISRAWRTFTLPWLEVARPDGDQSGEQYVAVVEGEELVIL